MRVHPISRRHLAPWTSRMRTRSAIRPYAVTVVLSIALEIVPLGVGWAIGGPVGPVIALIGFILAWAAATAGRDEGGGRSVRRGLAALPALLGPLLASYTLGLLVTIVSFLALLMLVGLWLHDLLAGGLVMLVTLTLVVRLAYVVPCLALGDDLVIALERSWLLTAAGGVRGMLAVTALALMALCPAVVLAVLTTGLPEPIRVASVQVALGLAGPVLFFGLERLRRGLEPVVAESDSGYARP